MKIFDGDYTVRILDNGDAQLVHASTGASQTFTLAQAQARRAAVQTKIDALQFEANFIDGVIGAMRIAKGAGNEPTG